MAALHQARPNDIAGIITRADKPKGRGLEKTPSPVKSLAQELNLRPVFEPEQLDDQHEKAWRTMAPDLGVVVAYGKILPKRILEIPKKGFINVHFSLLPKLRGAAPAEYAILEGLDVTGVTIFWLDEGMDTGPILIQRGTPVKPEETAPELLERLTDIGTELLPEALTLIEQGRALKTPQNESLATYAKRLNKNDGQLNWSEPAHVLERKIRAFSAWPTCRATIEGRPVQILKAKAGADQHPGEGGAGEITRIERPLGFFIKCGSGELMIHELRPEGGRAMSAWAFLQGIKGRQP